MTLNAISKIVDAMLCVGHRVRLRMFFCEICLVVVWQIEKLSQPILFKRWQCKQKFLQIFPIKKGPHEAMKLMIELDAFPEIISNLVTNIDLESRLSN